LAPAARSLFLDSSARNDDHQVGASCRAVSTMEHVVVSFDKTATDLWPVRCRLASRHPRWWHLLGRPQHLSSPTPGEFRAILDRYQLHRLLAQRLAENPSDPAIAADDVVLVQPIDSSVKRRLPMIARILPSTMNCTTLAATGYCARAEKMSHHVEDPAGIPRGWISW
jgi:hypothetical protein